jgi:hypothetical protein
MIHPLMAALDANRDGVLAADELRPAPAHNLPFFRPPLRRSSSEGIFTLSPRKAARCSRDHPCTLPQIQDPTELNPRNPESAGIFFMKFAS